MTKQDIIDKLNAYATAPDDEAIRYKEKIKQELLSMPELLFVLSNPKYEGELFDEDGNVNEDGSWDLYFSDNIRPYLYFPEAQADTKNFIAYKVEFSELPRYNDFEKVLNITFVIFCDAHNIIDINTGIARHDLIASIIREHFHWTNIFGTQAKIVNNKETITDANYVTRTLIFELTMPNSVVNNSKIINNRVRK